MTPFHVHQCQNEACRFRFPAEKTNNQARACPKCQAPTRIVATTAPAPTANDLPEPNLPQMAILLDNIRSLYNVGAIFRTADGAGIQQLYLCGITATPDHPKLAKTALGAAQKMTWTYDNNALDTAVALRDQGWQLWALESHPQAHPLFEASLPPIETPALLIIGNEKAGVDPELLALSDHIVSLPMLGTKASLNVAVAFGIAIYQLRFGAGYGDHSPSNQTL